MLPVAKILKSHGTAGGVLVEPYRSLPEEIDLSEPVFICFDGLPVPFFIEECCSRGSRMVWRLTDAANLEDAQELCGREVFMEMPEEIERAAADFTGWQVLDKGTPIGTVSGVEPIPGNLCLYVDTQGGTVMIPLHEDLVLEINPDEKRIDLDVPSGLY